MEKINNEQLRKLVYKNTIRVLREHKLYPIFRFFTDLPTNGPYYSLKLKGIVRLVNIAEKYKVDNPFHSAKTPDDIIKIMSHLESQFNRGEDSNMENPKTIQRLVMTHVNNLLHFCVERGVKDMGIMGVLGKEAYEMTCKSIIGDDFVDEMEERHPQVELPNLDGMDDDERRRIIEMIMRHNNHDNEFLNTIFQGENRVERRRPFVPSFFNDLNANFATNTGHLFDLDDVYDGDDDDYTF